MSEKLLNRRNFLKAAAFGAATTALAACAPQTVTVEVIKEVEKKVEVTKEVVKEVEKQVEVTKETVKEVQVTAAPVELTGELTIWGHADHPLDNALQTFTAKHPGVKGNFVPQADQTAAIEAALAAGSGLPDMSWYEADQVQVHARRGTLLDVSEVVTKNEKDLAPAKLAEAKYQGKYYGMPGDITPNNYWYRPDITEKAGMKDIPADIKYDAFLQLAKESKKQGSSLYVMNANFSGQGILPFLVAQYSLGGNVSDENSEVITLDDEIGEKAMEYTKQAWDAQAGLDADWFSAPYWANIKEGKLGGTWSPPWMRGFFETEVTSPDRGQGKWRNMLVPAYPEGKTRCNVWGGATLVAFKGTKDPALVMSYMEYTFASIEGATVTGNWGIIPPYLPWLKSNYFKLTKQTLFEKTWDWTGEILKALDAMRTDYYRMPAYGVMMGNMSKFVVPMLKGEKPIKDGMKEWGDETRTETKKLMDAIK